MRGKICSIKRSWFDFVPNEPIISIFRYRDRYGFEVYFEGEPVHYSVGVFASLDDCLAWCDAHRERVWETVTEGHGATIMRSTGYVVAP